MSSTSKSAKKLRQRVETERLANSAVSVPLTLEGTVKLLHELQVHQIELEGQNEELRRIREELDLEIARRQQLEETLEKSEQQLLLFIEHAPAALAMFDRDMRYLRVSRRWLSDYGLNGRNVYGLSHYEIFPEIPEVWKEAHRRGLSGEVLRAAGDRIKRADGTVQWVRWELRPWTDSSGTIGGIVIFSEDITDRKKGENALKASEERYRTLFEMECDALFLLDWETGTIMEANAAAVIMYDYTREELVRLSSCDLSAEPAMTSASIRNNELRVPLRWHRKKDGTVFPVEITGRYFDYQGRKVQVAAIRDITARLGAEKEMTNLNQKLHALSEHLQTAIEQERLAISRDIHDDLGQELTLMKLDIEWLKSRLPEDNHDQHIRLDEINGCVDKFTATVQRIAASLRPPLLDNAGLTAAIEWQIDDFRKRSGLKCFTMLNDEVEPLDMAKSTTVMRIIQEGLINVTRHARATEVIISLCKNDSGLLLEISDNGCGITPEQVVSLKSIGLIGMQERAYLCSGALKIIGAPGNGTTLTLTIPLETGESRV